MGLTADLAPELIIQIADFVDPPTLVDLACTCKFLESCYRDLLRKHRDASVRRRVVADVAPRSLTDMIRTAVTDPTLAWHVRDLEFTCVRTNWSHWEEIESGRTEDIRVKGPPLQPDYAFTQDEQVALLDQLRETFLFGEQEIDMAREDLKHGNDAPLKLLLLGLCPRIRSLKFTRHFHLTGRGTLERAPSSDVGEEPRSGLEYLHHAIIILLHNNSSAWPTGLNSLQDLAIGVDTENQTGNLTFAPSPLLITNLMKLPHLVSLYCFGLDVGEEDDTTASYWIDKGSSSVQYMFLHGTHDLSHRHPEAMITGCKQLKSLTIAGGDLDDVDTVVETAVRCHGKSLETLMFYETDRLHGYRRHLFEPEVLFDWSDLRTVYVDPSDVMLDAYGSHSHAQSGLDSADRVESLGAGHSWIAVFEPFLEGFMYQSFPQTMEVLVLGSQGHSGTLPGDAAFLDQAITEMIESGRRDNGDAFSGRFPHLKAIYLRSLDQFNYDHSSRRKRDRETRTERWFSNAIAAGRKYGIDVHTRTTRGRSFHQIDFPKPPMFASLEDTNSSPDHPRVFDVYTGKWGAANCGNCGTCEDCLEQYDVDVWSEVEKDLEREYA